MFPVCLIAQGHALVAGEGDRCCYCRGTKKQLNRVAMCNKSASVLFIAVNKHAILGGNDTVPATMSPDTSTLSPMEGTVPLVPTYPLPPGGMICFIFLIFQKFVLIVQFTLFLFISL